MSTHRIPILGWSTVPDASGKVWLEPYSVLATNDLFKRFIMRFDEDGTNATALTAEVGLFGGFNVPKNYVDTANLVIVWTSTIITNDVKFDFDYRAVGGNDTESLDQGTFQESTTGEDTAPSAAHERMEVSIALTDGNFAADDTVNYEFTAGPAAGTTLVGAIMLFDLYFEYNDA